MTEEFAKGNSYSSVNTLRSAISAILAPIDGTPAGSHPLIKRFMSGVFNIRPSLPRYSYTWDVNIVLRYIKSLGPNNEMSLKQLTIKLVTLVALLSGQRCQTISMLDLDHVDVTSSAVTFSVVGLTKTSKIGKRPIAVVLPKYPHEEPLCTVNALKHYLQKTRAVRGKNRNLFLSYVSPHKQVGAETISRWIKSSLSDAGIDTGRFKAHSTRAAACSAAFRKGVPLPTILNTAQWARCGTFAKFYNKNIIPTDQAFADAVLDRAPIECTDDV